MSKKGLIQHMMDHHNEAVGTESAEFYQCMESCYQEDIRFWHELHSENHFAVYPDEVWLFPDNHTHAWVKRI